MPPTPPGTSAWAFAVRANAFAAAFEILAGAGGWVSVAGTEPSSVPSPASAAVGWSASTCGSSPPSAAVFFAERSSRIVGSIRTWWEV